MSHYECRKCLRRLVDCTCGSLEQQLSNSAIERSVGPPIEPIPVSAMDTQVAGNHYKILGVQPMELVLKNMGYEAFKGACYVKINKYMIRNKDNEAEQLKKARHILDMWIEEAEKR